tara:strand:+ start:3079 stop:4182 length:1104 start_codon:yes stop_codon:yes gene_type:complete
MSLKCGIVGLPNVGKSTLFNALTKSNIPSENYPFCTIEPNIGVVGVPDLRLQKLAEIVNPKKIIPATIEFVDIAGLVSGASKGEGLGNQFLAHIRETDAIINVVRCFEDDNIAHVSGKIDPIDDILTISTELALADLSTVEKTISKEKKKQKSSEKNLVKFLNLLDIIEECLNNTQPVRKLNLTKEENDLIKPLCLITSKPAMYVANVSDSGFSNNKLLDKLNDFAISTKTPVLPICASIESEITNLDDNDKKDFLLDMGMEEPGLNRLIRSAFKLLGLHTYFTAGIQEVRAWTIKVGDTAPEAAGVIHTDFEKGFIRAQTINYEDFLRFKGEQGCKEAGKIKTEGKDYIVSDGDVINFLFNVSKSQ